MKIACLICYRAIERERAKRKMLVKEGIRDIIGLG